MRLHVAADLLSLGSYLQRFLTIIGRDRWFKRADQLDREQSSSPFLWQIVAHYHWLEMAISHQSDVVAKLGHLNPEMVDIRSLAALQFAGAVVEVHSQLSPQGQKTLEGRLRDSLKAETGFAALYLELDLAKRLADAGYDVALPDMEGNGRYDIQFSRGAVTGEVECKSISADAGRRIHRKDFYRFMEAISSMLEAHVGLNRREVLVVTLSDRLSSTAADQRQLLSGVAFMLRDNAPTELTRPTFRIERRDYDDCLQNAPLYDRKGFYSACQHSFGPNCHVAGGITTTGGCLVVMRSKREDDTSKPLLEAMRKAATQFSGTRPSFTAVQLNDIEPADLLLPHLRQRMGILSYALFGQYRASHVNATYFTGFGILVDHDNNVGTPGFAVPNPRPTFLINPSDAEPFLGHIPDEEFAAIIGVPLPAPDISNLPL
jgi:hypothetical protein